MIECGSCAGCGSASPPFDDSVFGAVARGWVSVYDDGGRHLADLCAECAPVVADQPRVLVLCDVEAA